MLNISNALRNCDEYQTRVSLSSCLYSTETQASQAETASEPTLLYSRGYMMYYVCFKCSKTEIRIAII